MSEFRKKYLKTNQHFQLVFRNIEIRQAISKLALEFDPAPVLS